MSKITTIYGDRDESDFIKTTGGFENDNELTSWVEYHEANGTLVHRSAHVHLKQACLPVGIIPGAFA